MNSCKQLMQKRKKIIRCNIVLAVVLVIFLALCFWNLIFSIPFIIIALIIANNENRITSPSDSRYDYRRRKPAVDGMVPAVRIQRGILHAFWDSMEREPGWDAQGRTGTHVPQVESGVGWREKVGQSRSVTFAFLLEGLATGCSG